MKPDVILGLITVAMAVLGGVVSAHAPTKRLHKVAYAVAFFFLGAASVVFVMRVSRDTAKSEADLNGRIGELTSATAEVARLQGSNNALEAKVLDLARVNASLAQKSISTLTGGNSFGYMDFTYDYGAYVVIFRHHGDYPVYDLHALACDVTEWAGRPHSKSKSYEVATYKFDIVELQTGGNWQDQDFMHSKNTIPFFERTSLDFDVFLSSRNGLWIEKMQLRQVNGHWTTALAVWSVSEDVWSDAFGRNTTKPNFEKSGGKLVFQQIPHGFPTSPNGKVVWGQ